MVFECKSLCSLQWTGNNVEQADIKLSELQIHSHACTSSSYLITTFALNSPAQRQPRAKEVETP